MDFGKSAESCEHRNASTQLFLRKANCASAVLMIVNVLLDNPQHRLVALGLTAGYLLFNLGLCWQRAITRPAELFASLVLCAAITAGGMPYSGLLYQLLAVRIICHSGREQMLRGIVATGLTFLVMSVWADETDLSMKFAVGLGYNILIMALLTEGTVRLLAHNDNRTAKRSLAELLKQNDIHYHMAFTDGLTGLYNYRAYKEKVQTLPQYVLLVIDIDHFKTLNDTNGHAVGNRILAILARIILAYVRKRDLTFRYGGEEFLVVLPETSQQLGLQIAERLREKIAAYTFYADSVQVKITVSIGVALKQPNVVNQTVFERADKALYTAKALGRNNVQIFLEKTTGV